MLSIGTCNQIQDISQGKGVVMPIAFRKATILLLVLVLIVALGIVAVGCGGSEEDADTSGETTSDQTYKVTIMGASPGGLWSLLGEGVSKAVAEDFPGSAITYETSGGGLANIPIVARGDAELGIAHNAELKAAIEGKEPFSEPVEDLYALAYVYNWSPFQYIIRQDTVDEYGIESLDDIVDKEVPIRVGVNQQGNIISAINADIFSQYGMPFEKVEQWGGQVIYSPSSEAAQLMKDRRLDMIANSLFAPHSSLMEVGQSVDVQMLSLKDSVRQKINEEWGTDEYVVTPDAYEWLEEEVPTVSLGAIIIVSKNVPEDEVYNLTKAMVENVSLIQGVHKSMRALTPELMAGQEVIPYHPGAEKYYKEAGLLE